MCFRPADVNQIDHKCPECGTNNLPEATMCARCFAPMEPMTEEEVRAQMAAKQQQGAGAPASAPGGAPNAPAAPAAPAAPPASFGAPKGDDNAVYF